VDHEAEGLSRGAPEMLGLEESSFLMESNLSLSLSLSLSLLSFFFTLFFIGYLFFIFINLGFSYLHFDCYSLSRFLGQHPPNPSPSPSILVFPSPSSPHYRPPPNNHVHCGGGSVLAGPRSSPSTRLFIATYEVGAQGQST